MTPTVHMLCGYIGSGKTTFGKQLEKEHRAIRFSSDFAVVTLFGRNPERAELDKYRDRVEQIDLRYARRALELGIDVVFDKGFWGRAARDAMRAFAASCGATVKMYYVTAPDAVMRERALNRPPEADDETMEIEPATWDALHPLFQPPQAGEEFTVITTA